MPVESAAVDQEAEASVVVAALVAVAASKLAAEASPKERSGVPVVEPALGAPGTRTPGTCPRCWSVAGAKCQV